MRHIIKKTSVSNIHSNVINFPAKKLRKKIRAPKIRMRRFFFFFKFVIDYIKVHLFTSCVAYSWLKYFVLLIK